MSFAQTVEGALTEWLAALDAEAWDAVAQGLDDDVQLADELTTGWLRGRAQVGAYLRASEGIVTDIVSTPSAITVRELAPGTALVTLSLHQRYLFDGVPRNEQSTVCACFRAGDGGLKLSLLQIAPVRATAPDADRAADLPERAFAAASDPQPSEETLLGDEVRRLRGAAGLSLRDLAERTGLSASFLSQVERSLADPSVSSLRRLADGLGVEVHDLLGRQERSTLATVRQGRAHERARVYVREAGVSVEPFGGPEHGALEAYIVEARPGHRGREAAAEEFMFVLEGLVDVRVGQSSVLLRANDGAHVAGEAPHSVGSVGDAPARYLVVQRRDG